MVKGGIPFDEGRQEFETRFIARVLDGADGHLGHAPNSWACTATP